MQKFFVNINRIATSGWVCVNIYLYIDYLDDIFLLVAGPTASKQSLYILFVFLKRFGCIIVVQGKGAEEY